MQNRAHCRCQHLALRAHPRRRATGFWILSSIRNTLQTLRSGGVHLHDSPNRPRASNASPRAHRNVCPVSTSLHQCRVEANTLRNRRSAHRFTRFNAHASHQPAPSLKTLRIGRSTYITQALANNASLHLKGLRSKCTVADSLASLHTLRLKRRLGCCFTRSASNAPRQRSELQTLQFLASEAPTHAPCIKLVAQKQTVSPLLLHRLITAGTSTHIAHCLAKPCVPQALRFERFGNCTSVRMIRPKCCTSHASLNFLRELQFGAPQQTRRQAQPASLQLP